MAYPSAHHPARAEIQTTFNGHIAQRILHPTTTHPTSDAYDDIIRAAACRTAQQLGIPAQMVADAVGWQADSSGAGRGEKESVAGGKRQRGTYYHPASSAKLPRASYHPYRPKASPPSSFTRRPAKATGQLVDYSPNCPDPQLQAFPMQSTAAFDSARRYAKEESGSDLRGRRSAVSFSTISAMNRYRSQTPPLHSRPLIDRISPRTLPPKRPPIKVGLDAPVTQSAIYDVKISMAQEERRKKASMGMRIKGMGVGRKQEGSVKWDGDGGMSDEGVVEAYLI